MAVAQTASLVFVVCVIFGVSNSATIYTRHIGNATEEDAGMTVQEAGTVICPPGYEPVEIYCYKINFQKGDFHQHKDLCFQSGGHLIEIFTSEENAALAKYMRSLNLDVSHYDRLYIGLVDMHWGTEHRQFYSWMSYDGLPYSNWAPGLPYHKPCVFVRLFGNYFGKWEDGFCQQIEGAICEASALYKLS